MRHRSQRRGPRSGRWDCVRPGVALLALLVITALWYPAALAQSPDPTTENARPLILEAEGGVRFQAPAWRASRHESSLAVLEAPGTTTGDDPIGFHMMLFAIERCAANPQRITWEEVRKNIVDAASVEGNMLTLDAGKPWTGLEGFVGRMMTGTMQAGAHRINVVLVAVAAQGKMITVTSLTLPGHQGAQALLNTIAQSITLGS